MPNCSVTNCKNSTYIRSHKKPNVSYHRFPHEQRLKEKWIDATGNKDWVPTKYSTICSIHFDESCYIEGKKRTLKKSAYPTIDILKIRTNEETIESNDAPKRASLLAGQRKFEEVLSDMDEPATFRVCRICLVTEEAMYNMSEHGLSAMYEQLTGSTNCTEDRLPQALCSKCVDRLSSANSFREMALKTKEVLMCKFDLSKHTITLKDIQPISEQMDEIRKQDVKLSRMPENEIVIEFDRVITKDDKKNERKRKLNVDMNNFVSTNDGEEAIINKVVKQEVIIDENNDSEMAVNEYEVAIEDDGLAINHIKVKKEVIKSENNEEIYEYPKADNANNEDKNETIQEKIVVVKIDEIIKKNKKILEESPADIINRYRRQGIKHKRKNRIENGWLELDGFTVTKLSYEEQVVEVQNRKESESYKQAPYKCKSCFKGFDVREKYKNHIVVHNEKIGAFECFICKRRYKQGTALKKHLRERHCLKYECKSCPFVSNHRTTAVNHRNFHAGRTYNCPHCDAQFNQLSTYKGHLRLKHVCEFVCEWCGYTYVSQQGLNMHKIFKHKMIDDTELKGPHCKECDVTFVSDEAYNRHFKVSSKHTTDIREFNSPKMPSGKRYRPVVPLKKIKCEQCGVTLHGMLEYRKHFHKTHYGVKRAQYTYDRKFMCEQCGRQFATLALLNDHSLTHSGAAHFSCDTCGKSFATKGNLVLHVKSHTAVHQCPLCDKQFTHSSNKYRHIMVTHKQHKDFKCVYCDKAFKSAPERKNHTEHVHLKKPWPKRHRNRINEAME